MSTVQPLAIGDRLARLAKLLDLFKNPEFRQFILGLIRLIPNGGAIADLIEKLFGILPQPAAASVDDADEQVNSCCAACNVTVEELDSVLRLVS